MIDVPQDIVPQDIVARDIHHEERPQQKPDEPVDDAAVFIKEARDFLQERDGTPRPLLREMARIKGGRIYSAVQEANPRRARDVATALLAALTGWALSKPLTRGQLHIVTLAGNCLDDRPSSSLVTGINWASNDGLVPGETQVREALDSAGHARPEVRDLVVCGLIRALTRASNSGDTTKASRVIDVAVELGTDLSQSKASELVDLLSSMTLPSTTSLKFGELRDRADPANRPDLAAITDPDDRSTMLGALPMLQAQIAVEVARKNREELLAQALMWLAQRLGDTIKHWMPPRAPHPAIASQHGPRKRNANEKPTGLLPEIVQRAVNGQAAAARQAAQALESFLRTADPVAEEWDAFLAASLGSLVEAAVTWRKLKNPSPEVSWNLAIFEATQPFTRRLAWRSLEHTLATYQANPQTALHGLYYAIKTLADAEAPADAWQASREFVIRWGPEVPDGRILLASLSLMDVETEGGYNRALDALGRWQLLADSPVLLPSITHRSVAESRQQITELRRDNRYSRRWVLLILCGAANLPGGTAGRRRAWRPPSRP